MIYRQQVPTQFPAQPGQATTPAIIRRIENIEKRLDRIERRYNRIERRITNIEQKIGSMGHTQPRSYYY